MKFKLKFDKLLNAFLAFNLLVNSLYTPLVVYAQEELMSPTPTPIAEGTSTPEPTYEPTDSPIPSEEPTYEPSFSPEPTDSSIPSLEPEATESSEPIVEQSLEPSSNPEESSSPEITPTATPLENQENGHIEAVILENTEASNIEEYDLDYEESGSATIQTDKLDYAPTDTVLITGSGFLPNEEYGIEITSETGNFKFADRVTSDEDGGLFYSYQLDGTYRPDYWVGVKDNEKIVAETTFTDSYDVCQNDVNGANDFTGQKDLTRMCGDYSLLSTKLNIIWNWDDAAWPGGNTGDGCALFDTDGDGNANYSLCVIVGGNPAAYISKSLYSCDDKDPDRCNKNSALSVSSSTSCTASVQDTDPFSSGDCYPEDTVASCSILMSDISAASAKLIDVCSYPSSQPNSAPSDCIVATKSDTGRIEVVKNLIPGTDSGLFDLLIDDSVLVSNIGNGGTTSEQVVLVGDHTFAETAGSSTSLSDYNISAVCKNNNGAGSTLPISGINPWTVNISEDEDVVCTITNSLKTGTIVVHKDVVGPHGEDIYDTQTYGIKLDSGSTYSIGDEGEHPFTNVSAGTHTIYETGIPAGSILLSITPDEDGDLSNGAQVTLGVGETKNVYVVNKKMIPSIYGHKYHDVNANGAYDSGTDQLLSGWTIFIDANENGDLDTGETSTTTNAQGEYSFLNVTSGLNVVCEEVKAGWTQSYPTDNSGCYRVTVGNLGAGNAVNENVDFLNYETPGLTVIKKVINDHGGTATVDDFEIKIGGSLISFGAGVVNGDTTTYTATPSVLPNISYLLSEKDVSGYTEGTWGCLDDDTGGTVSNPVVLNPGQDITCTITNDDQSGSIIITKDVVPVDTSKWNFTITTEIPGAGGPYAIPGVGDGLGDGDLYGLHNLIPGSYTITEISDSRYWTQISCDDGSTSGSNSIVVNVVAGDELECTFTNTKYNPAIQVEKSSDTTSITGAGQIVYYDFDVTNEGDQILTGITVTDPMCDSSPVYQSGDTDGDNKLDLTETWIYTCSHMVTLSEVNAGGNLSNTVTADSNESDPDTDNYDIPVSQLPAITIVKSVTEAFYDDTSDVLHYSFLVTNSGNVSLTGPVTVSDDKATNESCPAVSTVGNFDNELDPGESITCSASHAITLADLDAGSVTNHAYATADGTQSNTDQETVNSVAGKIIIEKQTLPDGSSQSFEFDPDWDSNFSLVDNGLVYESGWLTPGYYMVSEIVSTGWDFTGVSCDDSDSGNPTGGGSIAGINLSANETVTCTFTNTQRGHLIVDKITDPSSDTTTVFNINVLGGTVTNGSASRTIVGGETEDFEVIPGTYSVTENPLTGWYPQYACSGIIVSAGETEYCTINNTKYGSIRINKDSNPNDEQDFSFIASGTGVSNFFLDDDGDNGNLLSNTVLFSNLLPGAFTISEITGVTGWDLTSLVCSTDVVGKTIVPFIGTNIATLNLAAGENVICTFTNTQRGHIIIEKDARPNHWQNFNFNNNFGNSNPSTFRLDDDNNPTLPKSRTFEVLPGTYSVSENPVAGWMLDSVSCDDGSSIDSISVSPGETVKCIFVNKKLAKIILVKDTVGADGTFDFTMTGTGLPSSVQISTSGNTNSVIYSDLDPDNVYSVSETVPQGWDLTSASCTGTNSPNNITPNPDENIVCTFVNIKLPTLTINKILNPVGHGAFNLLIDGTVYANNVGDGGTTGPQIVSIGDHTFSEVASNPSTVMGDYIVTFGGDTGCNSNGTVNLVAGENKTCTITNVAYSTIIVTKDVVPDDSSTWNFEVNGIGGIYTANGLVDNQSFLFLHLVPGSYNVSETNANADYITQVTCNGSDPYKQNGFSTTVNPGQTVSCTFTNTKIPTLTVTKIVNPSSDQGLFNLFIDGNGVGSNVGNGFTSNPLRVDIGETHQVSETAGTGTDLNNYTASFGDGCDAQGVITLQAGENKNCTITNTKKGVIIVKKDMVGGIETFDFTGTPSGSISTDLGTIQAVVIPGQYTSTEGVKSGWDLDSIICDDHNPPVGGNSTGDIATRTATFNVEPGETVTCTFTNIKRGFIQGKKFEDVNNNGSRQGSEDYLNGWTIKLYKQGEGWEYTGQQRVTGHTGTLGQYRFGNLIPDIYLVCEELKSGWMQTAPVLGTEYNGTTCHEINLSAGQQATGYMFGNFELGKIQGMKFNDLDGDENPHETGEEFMNEWTVRLYNNWTNSVEVTTSNTGTQGQYRFEGLEPGTYQVCEVLDQDWAQTWPKSGDYPIGDNDVTHSEYGVAVENQSSAIDEGKICWQTVIDSSGDFNKLLRFGNTQFGSVDGYKFNDLDGNGERGEEPVLTHSDVNGGVVIFIDTNDNQEFDNEERSTNTDNNGYYKFDNLLAGTYDICEVVPSGWVNTFPSSSNCHSVGVTPGQTVSYDFGNILIQLELGLSKSNSVSGSAVTYTLVITNTGNQDLDTIKVTDALPGGFSYVAGSSKLDGVAIDDPDIIGGALVWTISEGLLMGEENSIKLTYEVLISSDLKEGTYTNLAYAEGIFKYGRELSESKETSISSSDVSISSGGIYSGSLSPQVLGLATELPATGNPTMVLIIAVGIGIIGFVLRRKVQKYEKN